MKGLFLAEIFSGKSFIAVRCKKLHSDAKNSKGPGLVTMKLHITAKQIAMIAIFAALFTVLRRMDAFPMIGVTGARFSLSDAIAPIYGIILGPYVGGASVIIGTFSAMALGKPVVFLGLDFLPALVNVIAIGFLIRRKWLPVVILYCSLLAIFLLDPYTTWLINIPWGSSTISFPFFWLHIVALVVLVSPLGYKAASWIDTLQTAKLAIGVTTLAFIGTMIQHLTGNILYEAVFGQPVGIWDAAQFNTNWNIVFYTYPWERLVLLVIAVLIGIPLVRVLKKSFFRSEKPVDSETTT